MHDHALAGMSAMLKSHGCTSTVGTCPKWKPFWARRGREVAHHGGLAIVTRGHWAATVTGRLEHAGGEVMEAILTAGE
eukprot:10338913-Alexandrium_andersonii.AAC.1